MSAPDANLEDAADRLQGPDRRVVTTVTAGRPGDGIVSLAEQIGADVIVLGSRGHGSLETMLLGSVSSEVVDQAHVPVLVARSPAIERVVFAWDGSERAQAALPLLIGWGLFDDTHVDVLSVADADPPWWAKTGSVSEEAAANRDGDPAETIVSFAGAHEADLVVLGTHGRTGLRRLLLGSVARNVLLHAHCSVLLAR